MDIRTAIAAERRKPAALLDGLSADSWDAPTLCAGWRVREVAAHMSLGFRCSFPRVAWELAKVLRGRPRRRPAPRRRPRLDLRHRHAADRRRTGSPAARLRSQTALGTPARKAVRPFRRRVGTATRFVTAPTVFPGPQHESPPCAALRPVGPSRLSGAGRAPPC
ncbi:maleylpyruvate isomerase N-terminal domain-containing protein [Streptomyces syringium]